jgi:hypothetical protein
MLGQKFIRNRLDVILNCADAIHKSLVTKQLAGMDGQMGMRAIDSLRRTMHDVLTFDAYPLARDVISEIVEEGEAGPADRIMAEAQELINQYHYAQIGRFKDEEIKLDDPADKAVRADFPSPPTVEQFSRIPTNGTFGPAQFLNSRTWGAISTRLDYGRVKGYERVLANFDLRTIFREAFVMASALERIPA